MTKVQSASPERLRGIFARRLLVINELMGNDASARFRFMMERAEGAQELDV
jgi:hypothetical protein